MLRSRKLYIILLFLLIAFHGVNNYIWLSKDGEPRGVDTIHNLNDQIKFYNKLIFISSDVGIRLGVKNLLSLYMSLFSKADPRNNTMHFIPSVANILFGLSPFVTRISNLLYFIILILSVYFIGKKVADKKTGLLAAFITSIYPGISGMSRQFEHDFPAIALVALSICILLYTEEFKNIKYSLLFGISLGLGILFRGQTLFFLTGPLGYIVYRTFLKNKHRDFTRFFNLILSISLAVLISSIWWGGHIGELARNFWHHVKVLYVPYTPSLRYVYDPMIQAWGRIPFRFPTINWFFFYLFNTIAHISGFFFLIFIIGLFIFAKSRTVREKTVIILWIIIPYIIFTVISVKFGHYYFPSFPAIALVSSAGILTLRWRTIKIPLVVLILSLGMTQFFILSYVSARPPHFFKLPVIQIPWCFPPKINNYNRVIGNFARIIKEKVPEGRDIGVGVITEWDPLIEYFLRVHIPRIYVFNSLHFNSLHGDILPHALDFLVVFGRSYSDKPDYGRLRRIYKEWSAGEKIGLSAEELTKKETTIKENIAFIDEMIETFQNYVILEKTLLLSERRYIFLTAKPILK